MRTNCLPFCDSLLECTDVFSVLEYATTGSLETEGIGAFQLHCSPYHISSHFHHEQPLLVVISCIGWVTNHFVGKKFVNQNDISAAVGYAAFLVSVSFH